MIPNLDNWIINLGAVVAALTVILGAIWKWILSPLYEVGVGDKIDVLTAKVEASAQDTAAQIAKVVDQLHSNGGSSLRDQTNRIEDTLKRHIAGERERHKIIAIELATTNARVDRLLRTGHTERVHISEQIVEHDPVTSPPLPADSED